MKQMKKLLSILLALALTFSVAVDVPVFAAEEEEPVAVERDLALNVWKTSSLEKGGAEWWQVTLPTNGWLNVKVQGYGMNEGGAAIYDADKVQSFESHTYYGASASNPQTMSFKQPLHAGTYWIKVYSRYNGAGSYKIWANEDSRPVTTVDSNSTLDSPQTIGLNQQMTGFFSRQDEVDIFRVVLPSATKLHYSIRSKDTSLDDMAYTLYDANYEEVEYKNLYGSDPQSWDSKTVLSAGIYYIKLIPRYGDHGSYVFSCGPRYMVSSIAISGKTSVQSGKKLYLKATVNPSNAANKEVYWSSSDSYIASVDSNGTVSASSSACGAVIITATSKDNENIKAQYKIYVLPGKLTINYANNYSGSWYRRKMYVSCSSMYGAAAYQVQYSTDKKFKHAKTKIFKNYSSNYIKGLVKGKTYYVRERAMIHMNGKKKYGPWSNVKKCKIRY